MEYVHHFQIMILLATAEFVHSVYVMRRINDDAMWHRVASKMLLLVLMVVAIGCMLLDNNTTLMLIWVVYFIYLTHKGNREFLLRYLEIHKKEGDNDGLPPLNA